MSLHNKIGLPPGTLVHVGSRKADKAKISVIHFSSDHFSEKTYDQIEDCFQEKQDKGVRWINIDGLHDINLIEKIGQHFGLHPLLLEDVLNTNHRPKLEEYEDHVFLTLKMLGISSNRTKMVSEQVSFVLGDGWILSFQEKEGDIFGGLRERLKEGKGLTRTSGSDYLLYRLVDTVVDHYFYVTEFFSEETERLEERVLKNPSTERLNEIQSLKRELIHYKKQISPLREAIGALQKDSSKLVKKSTLRYLHDVYEHVIQVSEIIETQRDILSSIMDLYLSGVSNKMNQVMQVLTIISTIFIPLTFIAGIYGMNFQYMPELSWKYGYFAALGVMLIVVIGLIFFFRKKKWL